VAAAAYSTVLAGREEAALEHGGGSDYVMQLDVVAVLTAALRNNHDTLNSPIACGTRHIDNKKQWRAKWQHNQQDTASTPRNSRRENERRTERTHTTRSCNTGAVLSC